MLAWRQELDEKTRRDIYLTMDKQTEQMSSNVWMGHHYPAVSRVNPMCSPAE